jgi:hypothetical protein
MEEMMTGICGAALVRAANAMLAALGGDQVSLLLPANAMAGDAAGQLGLVDPGVQQVVVSPVVTHNLPITNSGPARKIEFTLPASVLEAQLPALGIGTVEELFETVMGLMYDGDLFHIEAVVPENFAGTAYFYVVTAVE